ncbi:MAG: GFA family protein [Pseudomonadota bacterium]
MGELTQVTGACLCGTVKITADARAAEIGACHCTMCRTWGGGPFLGVDCGTTAQITGREHVTTFDSSEWAERGFCTVCGTHLFYRLKQQDRYIVPAGFFEHAAAFSMDHQLFIDHKPEWYAFAGETKNMTGQQVFDIFAAQQT